MDSLPLRDFMYLFDRVTDYVNLKQCYSPEDIMLKIQASKAFRKPGMAYSRRQKKWVRKRGSMMRLVTHGFPERVAREFRKFDSKSMITLTLLFGKEKAQEIKKMVLRRKVVLPSRRQRKMTKYPVERRKIGRVTRELRRREAVRRRPRWWRREKRRR